MPEWRGTAEAAMVPQVRRGLRAYGGEQGWPKRLTDDVALAVTEALTNVVVHAYADSDRPGVAHVTADVRRGTLRVVVRDEGGGMKPRVGSPGLGLGLAMVTALADEVDVGPAGRTGAKVTMTWDVGARR